MRRVCWEKTEERLVITALFLNPLDGLTEENVRAIALVPLVRAVMFQDRVEVGIAPVVGERMAAVRRKPRLTNAFGRLPPVG